MKRSTLPALLVRTSLLAAVALSVTACASPQIRMFSDAPTLWEDPDRGAVEEMPESYFSGFAWDFLDQTFFRPLNRYLAADYARPSVNVNAYDEVADSSWFENRLGWRSFSLEDAARGACPDLILDPEHGPWLVTDAKPNGANPGFIIRDPQGRGWLLKFDGHEQPERATAADVFGSRIYHAAGFHAPCNIVINFDPSVLEIAGDAEAEGPRGEDVPMEPHHVQQVLDAAVVMPDGSLRASASLFLDGRPIGPWRYQGTRRDDPNDVVEHEDRRELRGARLLAAWLNHFDAREQNTLSTWHTDPAGSSYVKHYYLDFGDCLGSRWDQDPLSRRFGNSYYVDVADGLADLLTFGAILRPWHTVTVDPVAPALGYYDVEHLDAADWSNGYPNPAFSRMQDEDGAWMARILADFTDEHVRVMLDESRISDAAMDTHLFRILLARRDRLLAHWLRVRSPLTHPEVSGDTICLEDLSMRQGVVLGGHVRYETRWYVDEFEQPAGAIQDIPHRSDGVDGVCVPLPEERGEYAIVDVLSFDVAGGDPIPPLRLHLRPDDQGWALVGMERPEDSRPPADTR